MNRTDRLLACILQGGMPHAIAVTGPAGCGKATLARRAAALYCIGEDAPKKLANCPNYAELAGAGVGVKQVRELMAATAARAFNGGRRAFLITDAHAMAQQSQNALLKTLEEPPADTLLLLTGNETGLLPTVRSRCMMWRIGAQPLETIAANLAAQGVDSATAQLCARASDGVMGVAQRYAEPDGSAFRKDGAELLRQALFCASPFASAEALTAEDTAREGKRRRTDAQKLLSLIALWESLSRDALLLGCGLSEADLLNPDGLALSTQIAQRFTDGQIRGIIELFGAAQKRLQERASASLVLDTLLAKLSLCGV